MCSEACRAGHSTGFIATTQFEWNSPVPMDTTTVTIKGLVSCWPPPVCSGTGWLPAYVQGNPYWTPGSYFCGICRQLVEVDLTGRLVLHPYVPKA